MHYIVYVVIMMVVGLSIAVTEAFIPSFGLLTLASLACQAGGIYLAFTNNVIAGYITLAAAIVLTPTVVLVALNYFPNLPIGKWFILRQNKSDKSERIGTSRDLSVLLDSEGVALSKLHPSGIGKFDNERVSVVTRGEMVEKDARIKVIKASANHVVVKEIKTK